MLSVLSFYSILIFGNFFRTIIQNFIPHIFKTLIIVELNSQLTCNNGIITYKCITYSINNQRHLMIIMILYVEWTTASGVH